MKTLQLNYYQHTQKNNQMANQYLKYSKLDNDQFFIFLELFVEDRTSVYIEEQLEKQCGIQYGQDSINKNLNKIRNSLIKDNMFMNDTLKNCLSTLQSFENGLRYVRKWSSLINYSGKNRQFYWVHIQENKLYLRCFFAEKKSLEILVNQLEFLKNVFNEDLCHGLIQFKDGVFIPLYSNHNCFDHFLKFHNERIKKHYGLREEAKIGYFFESIFRFNYPSNLLEKTIKQMATIRELEQKAKIKEAKKTKENCDLIPQQVG